MAAALTEVCFGDEDQYPLAETIDRYFAPGYRQRTDGEELTRDEFTEHIRALRGRVVRGHVEVLQAVRNGGQFADRHRVEAVKPDGSVVCAEVYLFGELADDGRLARVDEVSRIITGSPEDADLARAR